MTASARLLIVSVALILKFAASSKVERNICPSRNVSKYEEAKTNSCLTLDQCGRTHCMESNMIVSMGAGQHELQATLNLSNISNLVLTGVSTNTTYITCSNSSAIVFNSCSNITLKNLTIKGCGVESKTAAVFFQDDDNVTLEDVTISDSICAAIVAYNVKGTMSLLNSVIRDIKPAPNVCAGNTISYINANNSSYHFIANNAHFSNSKYNSPKGSAGLSLIVSNCFANITITNSEFTNNYHNSSPGGNLRIILQTITKPFQHRIHLENVTITQGKAYKGGGLYINMSLHPDADPESQPQSCKTMATFKNVTFHNNSATVLGAGLYIQQTESPNVTTCQNIQFIHCVFTHNSIENHKNGGVAIHSNSYTLRGFLVQTMPQYQTALQDCFFSENGDKDPNTTENSVVVINDHNNFRIDSITVKNNSCNAITAIHSNLVFSGSTILKRNSGSSGGGLLLCESAILYFKPNTYIEITNNSVRHAGGGICIQPQCLEAHPRCFFQFYKKLSSPINTTNITIYLSHNTAEYAGNNIFGGDVDYCYLLDSSKYKKELNKHDHFSETVFTTLFKYSKENSTVTSPPRRAFFCSHSGNLTHIYGTQHIYPGQHFYIPAVLVGQLNGIVPGVVTLSVDSGSSNHISPSKETFPTTTICRNETITIKMSKYTADVKLSLKAEHRSDQSGFENLMDIDTKSVLPLSILPCPVGSKISKTKGCVSIIPNITLHMNEDESPVLKFDNQDFWIQYNNGELYYNSFCPSDYCKKSKHVTVSQLMDSNNYSQCQYNRANIFCGECAKGYSAMLGTNSCGKCDNNFKMLLPIALVGIALVIFLTLSNLTVSEGTLSGFIFYINIIEANSTSLVPACAEHKHSYTYLKVLRTLISWLNFDPENKVCLYKGMDAYAKAWLAFLFPIYIWILTYLIVVTSEKYQWIARLASKKATKVLATLVLLSYTKLIKVIISNLSYIQYHRIKKGSLESTTSDILWLIDPNIHYWSLKHATLFTFSLLFALVCLPFTLLLLFIKPLQKFSHLRPLKWIASLKPFLDAFTGPYTDNGRFWPGMLLVARIAIFVTTGMNSLNEPTVKLGITLAVMTLILIVAAMVRPGLYTDKRLDYLEYFFMFNLCALCFGKSYSYHLHSDKLYVSIFTVLVSLSLLTFAGIVFYHIWLQVRKLRIVAVLKDRVLQKHAIFRRLMLTKDPLNQRLDNYPPHVHQREPLIADHEE